MAIVIALATMIRVLALTIIAINAFPTQWNLRLEVESADNRLCFGPRDLGGASPPQHDHGIEPGRNWRTGLSEYTREAVSAPLVSII